jgi:hypothetical protein
MRMPPRIQDRRVRSTVNADWDFKALGFHASAATDCLMTVSTKVMFAVPSEAAPGMVAVMGWLYV